MALPLVVESQRLIRGHNPPHKSSGGNYYFVTAGSFIDVEKTADPATTASTIQDGANGPARQLNTGAVSSVSDGTNIHIVCVESGGLVLEYSRFNMSTDSWDVVDSQVADLGGMSPVSGSVLWCSIALRPSVTNQEVVIAACSLPDAVMGSSRQRISFWYGPDGTPSWSGPFAIDPLSPTNNVNVFQPVLATGTNDVVHVVYCMNNVNPNDPPTAINEFRGATISTSNAVSTPVTQARTVTTLLPISNLVSYDDGGTQRLMAAFNLNRTSLECLIGLEDGSDNYSLTDNVAATTTTAYRSNSGHGVASMVEENGKLHLLFSGGGTSGVDSDLYYTTSDDNGATWSTDEEVLDGVSIFAITAAFLDAGKIGYFYDDGNVTKFGEYVLSVAGQQVDPTGIPSAEAFGSFLIDQAFRIYPGGIASAEAFGDAYAYVPIQTLNHGASFSATTGIWRGPHQVGDNLYAVNVRDQDQLAVFKAPYSASSASSDWKEQHIHRRPSGYTGQNVASGDSMVDSNGIIHVVSHWRDHIYYHKFDTATDKWILQNELIAERNVGDWGNVLAEGDATIHVFQNGNVLIAANIYEAANSTPKVWGFLHNGSSWSTLGQVDHVAATTAATTCHAPKRALSNGKAVVVYRSGDPSKIYYRTISDAGVLDGGFGDTGVYAPLDSGASDRGMVHSTVTAFDELVVPGTNSTDLALFVSVCDALTLGAGSTDQVPGIGSSSNNVFACIDPKGGKTIFSAHGASGNPGYLERVYKSDGGSWGSAIEVDYDPDNGLTGYYNLSPDGNEVFVVTTNTTAFTGKPHKERISSTSIESAEAFGTPEFLLGLSIVSPAGIGSGEIFGSPSVVVDQTVDVPGIASAETFGTAVLQSDSVVSPASILSAEAFGAAILDIRVNPAGIISAEAFGSVSLDTSVTVSPAGIDSAEAFGAPLLTILLEPAGIPSQEAFGAHAITSAYTVSPAGIPTGEVHGSHALQTTVTLNATGIPSGEAFGNPVANATGGEQNVSVPGIASGEAFGSVALTIAADVAGIASLEAFGTPLVDLSAQVSGIASQEAFGAPDLSLTGFATGIPSGEQFGAAQFNLQLSVNGIDSAESFGSADILYDQAISPVGIASGEAVGSPVVSSGEVVIGAPSIASAEAFGDPALNLTLLSVSIDSAEAFGGLTVQASYTATAVGIASAEAFGSASVSAGLEIVPAGIPSAEAFGGPDVFADQQVAANGIASAETFGDHAVEPGAVTVTAVGIASAESHGTPEVGQTVHVAGIASAEAVGAPDIQPGAVTVEPAGIASQEALGAPAITSNGNVYPIGIASAEAFGSHELLERVGGLRHAGVSKNFIPSVVKQNLIVASKEAA